MNNNQEFNINNIVSLSSVAAMTAIKLHYSVPHTVSSITIITSVPGQNHVIFLYFDYLLCVCYCVNVSIKALATELFPLYAKTIMYRYVISKKSWETFSGKWLIVSRRKKSPLKTHERHIINQPPDIRVHSSSHIVGSIYETKIHQG